MAKGQSHHVRLRRSKSLDSHNKTITDMFFHGQRSNDVANGPNDLKKITAKVNGTKQALNNKNEVVLLPKTMAKGSSHLLR